jgi:hypothetical protein
MRSLIRLAWLSCAITVVTAPSATWAQSGATLQGTVFDEQSGVLPGATVTIANTETGWVRTTVTDERGWYRATALPPGRYEVRVELQGFVTQVRPGLTLTVGQEATIDLTLRVSTIEETVTVTGDAPLVATTSNTLETTVTRDRLDTLPLPGRSFQILANLAPGMLGVGSGGPWGSAFAGAQLSRNTNVLVDGASTVSGSTASAGSYSLEAVREYAVMMSQFTAEYGMGAGAIISVVTRSGTNDFQGRGFLFHRDDSLDAQDVFSKAQGSGKAPFSQQLFGGFVGGPILRDRLHYFGSYEGERRRETAVTTSPLVPVSERETPHPYDASDYFVKTDYRITNNHALTARVRVRGSEENAWFIGGLSTRDRGVDVTSRGKDLLVTETAVLSSRALNEFRVQVRASNGDYDPSAYSPLGTPAISRPSGNFGKATQMPQASSEDVYEFIETFSYSVGSHDLKAGADIRVIRNWTSFLDNKDGLFLFRTDAPFDPANQATYPFQFTQVLGDPVEYPKNEMFMFFVQDTWRYRHGLTFNIGLRYDTENAFKNARGIGLPDARDNFAPRVGVSWDPFGNGRTAIRGGFGVYYDKSFLNITGNITKNMRAVGVTILNPGYPDPYAGGTVVPVKQSTVVPPPDVKTPVTRTISLGIKREVISGLAVSADAVTTRGYHLYSLVDTNYPDPVTRVRPDPDFLRMTTYDMNGHSWYDGLLLALERRSGRGPRFNAAYTLSRAIRDVEDFTSQSQANDLSLEKGYASNHRKHQLVVSSTWALPWGLQVAAVLQARSGLPWNVTTGTDNNGDTVTNDRPDLAVPDGNPTDRATYSANFTDRVGNLSRNANIGPGFMTIDARISKFVKTGSQRIEAFAEVFNATNRANYGSPIGNLRSASFGRPTALAGAPRQVELGFRVDF